MRVFRVGGVGAVLVLSSVMAVPPAGAQSLPPVPDVPIPDPSAPLPVPGVPAPGIPSVPGEAEPVQRLVGPAGWAACNTAATGLFLAVFGGGLVPAAPVPADVPVTPLSVAHLVAGYANPALGLGCGAFGPPVSVAACTTDASLGVIPFVALKPAGTVVTTIAAVETLLASAGAPVAGAVSAPVGGALGCGTDGAAPPGWPDVDALPGSPDDLSATTAEVAARFAGSPGPAQR